MATYLFTWNPAQWDWTYLNRSIAEVTKNGYCLERWSCGVTRRIMSGDRAFLMKLGAEPRGIVAAGWVASGVYEDRHWSRVKRAEGKTALYVNVRWDTILDSEVEIFPLVWLGIATYSSMHWEPQASGTRIPDNVSEKLEKHWAEFLGRPAVRMKRPLDEEIDPTKSYPEGLTKQVTVNVYERNAEARTLCINYYGPACSVCGFNFEKTYGEMGAGFIHVHHVKPLAEIRKGYKIRPLKDLRPVCPNCHSMLHQQTPPFSVGELRARLTRRKRKSSTNT